MRAPTFAKSVRRYFMTEKKVNPMSKERLEEIKQHLVLLHNAEELDDETKSYIFEYLKAEWLIERVQKLEERLNALITLKKSDANAMGVLMEQNKRYREAMEQCLTEGDFECIHEQLERIVTTLSEALEGESDE